VPNPDGIEKNGKIFGKFDLPPPQIIYWSMIHLPTARLFLVFLVVIG